MKCLECGRSVPEDSAFCPKCGARLDGEGDNADHDPHAGAGRMQGGGPHGPARDVPEEELWSGNYSPKAMVGPMIGLGVLTVLGLVAGSFAPPFGWMIAGGFALVVWAWLVLTMLYRKMAVRYRLTSHRFFIESGLVTRTDEHMQVIAIDDVTVKQGPIQRISDVGDIVLRTKDRTNEELTLHGIEGARLVADKIDKARRAERNRRGLYTTDM